MDISTKSRHVDICINIIFIKLYKVYVLKPPSFERQDEFQFELYKETLEELGFSNKDSFRPVLQ